MGALLWRSRQQHDPLLRVFAHVRLERRSFCVEAKMLQQISKPLRPGDRRRSGSGRKFPRIEPFGEFRQNRSHLTESTRMIDVTNKVECRCLGRRHQNRAPQRIEALDGHVFDVLAGYKRDAYHPALNRPPVLCDKDLEFLRALMRRAVILCGRQ